MTRVVLDSNVWISAVLFGGNPAAVVELAERGVVQAFTSQSIIEEIEETLRVKFDWSERRLHMAMKIWRAPEIVQQRFRVVACSDPDDNHILECALSARAGFIVTGDRQLLAMSPFRRISILTPRQFLDDAPWLRI